MPSAPTVSAIIPVFNGAAYVGAAIASVLAQTRPVDEVIVVDDGSTDDTLAVLEELGAVIRVVRQEHRGDSAARNHGVAMASGDLLAFLDHDDLWEPSKTERQIAALTRTPAPEAVFGHVVQFVSPELPAGRVPAPPGGDVPVPGHITGAMLVPRATFDAVGPFEEIAEGTGFIDWFARLLDAQRTTVMVPEVVLRRRLHPGNLTRHLDHTAQTYARAMRRVIDRRHGRRIGTPPGILPRGIPRTERTSGE